MPELTIELYLTNLRDLERAEKGKKMLERLKMRATNSGAFGSCDPREKNPASGARETSP